MNGVINIDKNNIYIQDFLDGKVKLEFRPFKLSKKEIKKRIEEIHKQQQDILDRQKVDWNELNKFTIDI